MKKRGRGERNRERGGERLTETVRVRGRVGKRGRERKKERQRETEREKGGGGERNRERRSGLKKSLLII